MNNYNLSLSSNSTSYTEFLNTVELDDYTQLNLDLNNLYNDTIPAYVKISWGDGAENLINNDIYDDTWDNQLTFFTYNPVFNDTHSHEYYPSFTSTYKNLSAQVLVSYTNGEYSYFLIPIIIKTYDISEALGRITVENTNISKNELELQLNSDNGVVEMIIPRR